MKIIGESIFKKDAEGELCSRIGTMFFRTPGLVTEKSMHALQRIAWIEHLNAERTAAGLEPLSMSEEDAEMAESVDLIFTEDQVLIRPDPDRMDLAFRADEELQKSVSKRQIRYLNTHSAKVREALRERGENWRMARQPISQDDMTYLIEHAKVPIGEHPIYYYNRATGTRYITCSGYAEVAAMPDDEYVRQVREVVHGMNKFNRHGHPEVDVFPPAIDITVRKALKQTCADEMNAKELRLSLEKTIVQWRMALPPELREETPSNYEWRNEMCHALTRGTNETAAEEQELIAGIAPEFYRQIEWLPGARIENGEVIFDSEIFDEREKSLIFNTTRLFGSLDYINVGRIVNSLARHPVESNRRGDVYIMQYREAGAAEPKIQMIRLQKWDVAERLDEGKDLLQAILETDEYSDFILDRRLMCRQLGMNLPRRLCYGHFTERYRGKNAKYTGATVRTAYFVRTYISGIASDKIPPAKFRNPAFAQAFAFLMGEAAALDLIVGRRNSVTRELSFDQNYEVIKLGEDGIPHEVCITDHAGSFMDYERDYAEYIAEYAWPIVRRHDFVANFSGFADAYVEGFRRQLAFVQNAYRERRRAFDELFRDRPYDTAGSGAYRWACALKRLDGCDPARLAEKLKIAIATVC